jgi:N-acetylglucosamine kinase-like BadF-type ATPase
VTAPRTARARRPQLLAVDGGGSKVDAVLVGRDGDVRAALRFRNTDHNGTSSDQYLDGVALAMDALRAAVGPLGERLPLAGLGMYCLAGADLPADDRRITRWLGAQGWTRTDDLRNDTFAVLRAGTDRTWGVAVVCGYGTNCSAVAPDGRTFRFPAVGDVSGDWGGGHDIGSMALWYALRAQDGRGERTALSSIVPAHFGLRRPRQVMEAMYFERIPGERVVELPPLVFRAAADGDAVARSIADRQADEIVAMAGTAIRRLRMTRLDVDVVLGGGIFRNDDPAFHARIEEGLRRVAPSVRIRRLTAPPVLGAALLGLDRLGASRAAKARLRRTLTHERMERGGSRSRARSGHTTRGVDATRTTAASGRKRR